MEQRCWVNFQCRGVLLFWMIVGQGPIALAVGAGGGCLDIFFLIYLFSFPSPSLWEILLFVWYFPQFCTSDMSKYGYLEVFQRVPSISR